MSNFDVCVWKIIGVLEQCTLAVKCTDVGTVAVTPIFSKVVQWIVRSKRDKVDSGI